MVFCKLTLHFSDFVWYHGLKNRVNGIPIKPRNVGVVLLEIKIKKAKFYRPAFAELSPVMKFNYIQTVWDNSILFFLMEATHVYICLIPQTKILGYVYSHALEVKRSSVNVLKLVKKKTFWPLTSLKNDATNYNMHFLKRHFLMNILSAQYG